VIAYVYPADVFGCGFYRMMAPARALKDQGYDVRLVIPNAREGIGGDIDTRTGRLTKVRLAQPADPFGAGRTLPTDADVIVMQRVSMLHLADAIPMMRAQGVAVVVDMDDDLTRIDPGNPAFRAMHPKYGHPRHNWGNAHRACMDATLVTVSTPALLKVYAPHGRGVVIENRIPAAYLEVPKQDSAVIGWPGSTHSHPTDLQQLGPSIARLIREGVAYRGVGPVDGLRGALGLETDPDVTGTVDMADWPGALAKLGIGLAPLADTEFNRSKCLDAETRIATDRGILRIADIVQGDQVWHGEWRKVEATETQPERDGLEIATESGRCIRLSREHRLWETAAGWTAARDLAVGDELSLAPDSIGASEIQLAPWPADSRMTRGAKDWTAFADSIDGPMLAITPRWGRLLGLFAGDGCATGTHVVISCDGQDQDLIDLISDDWRAVGLWPATQAVKTWGGEPLRRRSVDVASAHLIRFMRNLGLVRNDSVRRIITVPEIIWRSPESVVSAYLAGLFEADGSLTRTSVTFSTKYHEFALQVQRLLVAFGIESTVRSTLTTAGGKRFESWRLRTRRAGSDIFAERIGFLSERKQAKLAALAARPHSNAYRHARWRDRIVEITSCRITPVDIQVDQEAFAAAGFLSHNSWLKPLELMACGTPWVASPRAEYQRLQTKTGTGLLARKPNDWYQQIKRLAGDETLRRDMSDAGRAAAATMTIEGNAWRWLEAWESAVTLQRQMSPASV
jgi:hypothetical protein